MDFQPRERSVKSAAVPVRALLQTGINTGGYVRWETFPSILPHMVILSDFPLSHRREERKAA